MCKRTGSRWPALAGAGHGKACVGVTVIEHRHLAHSADDLIAHERAAKERVIICTHASSLSHDQAVVALCMRLLCAGGAVAGEACVAACDNKG